ncbi:MAG: hypothetical protein AAGD32_05145 [Planctomycetota bacterium]
MTDGIAAVRLPDRNSTIVPDNPPPSSQGSDPDAPTNTGGGQPARSFTGRKRRHTTPASIKIADSVSKWVITVGGLSVIGALALILLFLASVVVPLFGSAELNPTTVAEIDADKAAPVAVRVDENVVSFWIIDEAGALSTFRTQEAELIETRRISDVPVTAVSVKRSNVAIGREDGTVLLGSVPFGVSFPAGVPDALEGLNPGDTAIFEGGVAELIPGNRIRVTTPNVTFGEPVAIGKAAGDPSPIKLLDYLVEDDEAAGGDEALVVLREDGRLFYEKVTQKRNLMTNKVTKSLSEFELPMDQAPTGVEPVGVFMQSRGRGVYLVYEDGQTLRFDTTDPENARVVEVADLLPETDRTITAARMLIGDVTLIVGDSAGGVSGWFATNYPEGTPDDEMNPDDLHMVQAHTFAELDAAVTAFSPSERDRQFLVGDALGNITLFYMTTSSLEGTTRLAAEGAIDLATLSPRADAALTITDTGALAAFDIANDYPGDHLAALFTPIHYEGYPGKDFQWQSGGGTDDAEPKVSFVPLIFGTLKATLYAMLFAVPIAILGAIYTSEFMDPRAKAVVKPTIEMMAGLPSVVLGFIGGLVLAPIFEDIIPGALLTFVCVPAGVFMFGWLWQLLPPDVVRPLPKWVPFIVMIGAVLVTFGAALLVAPLLETILYGGDIKAWLNRRTGTGFWGTTAGWIGLLTPLLLIGVVFVFNTFIRPRLNAYNTDDRKKIAGVDGIRLIVSLGVAILLATAIGGAFTSVGLDLRGDWSLGLIDWSPAGTYITRNSVIIGIMMGFAVIPIIYTISEDALSSVPNTLRSAALGAGATPWQTAIRVVLPVGISGIFSACMIGLGRAVGETMIVLMAYGNTPILDGNIFNGGRTMAANIAVEMPEAPQGETLYRYLFASALILFAMTFVINTIAEVVRNHFRKRALQL